MGCEQVRDTYEDLVRKSDRSLSRFKHKFDTKNITEVCDVLELYCRLDREYDCKHDSGTEKDAFDAELLKRLLQRYAPAAHHNRLLIAERTHARSFSSPHLHYHHHGVIAILISIAFIAQTLGGRSNSNFEQKRALTSTTTSTTSSGDGAGIGSSSGGSTGVPDRLAVQLFPRTPHIAQQLSDIGKTPRLQYERDPLTLTAIGALVASTHACHSRSNRITLRLQKSVASLVKHINKKWSEILHLYPQHSFRIFPFQDDASSSLNAHNGSGSGGGSGNSSKCWTENHKLTKMQAIYTELGSPSVMRMQYDVVVCLSRSSHFSDSGLMVLTHAITQPNDVPSFSEDAFEAALLPISPSSSPSLAGSTYDSLQVPLVIVDSPETAAFQSPQRAARSNVMSAGVLSQSPTSSLLVAALLAPTPPHSTTPSAIANTAVASSSSSSSLAASSSTPATPSTPISTAVALAFASPASTSPLKTDWLSVHDPNRLDLFSNNSNSFLSPFKSISPSANANGTAAAVVNNNNSSIGLWAAHADDKDKSEFFAAYQDYSPPSDPFLVENANSNRSTGFFSSIFASK